jgi:hypothetical protein
MGEYWRRTEFWGKFRDTFAVLGSFAQIVMNAGNESGITDIDSIWIMFSAIMTIAGTLTGIWFTDKNNDGIVDMFEKNKIT